jgi:hypothetical protein
LALSKKEVFLLKADYIFKKIVYISKVDLSNTFNNKGICWNEEG